MITNNTINAELPVPPQVNSTEKEGGLVFHSSDLMDGTSVTTMQQLVDTIVSKINSVATDLDSKIDHVDRKLEARTMKIHRKIDIVAKELSANIDGVAGALAAKLDRSKREMAEMLDHVTNRINSLEAKLEYTDYANLDSEVRAVVISGELASMGRRLDTIESEVEFHGGDIDGLVEQLEEVFSIVKFIDDIRRTCTQEKLVRLLKTGDTNSSLKSDQEEDSTEDE